VRNTDCYLVSLFSMKNTGNNESVSYYTINWRIKKCR